MNEWQELNQQIVNCQRCPRLIDHCREIASTRRRAYANQEYWGRPVPNFGRGRAAILFVGLAPGAHGANRTGRMFTGDRSGDWLYRALHKAGLANQSEATDVDDGMQLVNCAITAVCHCAPPGNRPDVEEIAHCQEWLVETIRLTEPLVYVALGGLAWKATVRFLVQKGLLPTVRTPNFSHAAHESLEGGRHLLGSYHPSQQNTFTGKLTEPMLDDVMALAVRLAGLDVRKPKRKK